jgi:hypothetical protein
MHHYSVFLAVTRRPIVAIFLRNFSNVLPIQLRPRLFQSGQYFPLVELGARLVVVVVFDFLSEHFDDDFAVDGLPLVDGQPTMILKKIGQLKLGNRQDVSPGSGELTCH